MDEVVDTGLTMHYLSRTLALRRPVVAHRRHPVRPPIPRLVDDLPISYVGFTVPDEFFVGYGFDLDERWRNLPDLHLLQSGWLAVLPTDVVDAADRGRLRVSCVVGACCSGRASVAGSRLALVVVSGR